jgi:GTP-binding protein
MLLTCLPVLPSARYMERQLRDNIGFEGTPLRLLWRGKPASDIKRREQAQQAQQQGSSGSSKK